MLQLIGLIVNCIFVVMFIMMFNTIGEVNDKLDILVGANSDRVYQETLKELNEAKK